MEARKWAHLLREMGHSCSWMAGLLDALGVAEPVVYCGLSMGGYIGWQFYRKHASRMRAMILCDTRAVADTPEAREKALAIRTVTELAAALSRAQPRGKLWPFPGTPGIMRRPWGEGWALVGDAGSFRDPLTAHGLTDALRDAELLARAVVAGGPGALAGYQAIRDRAATTFFDLSDRVASFEWDLEELKVLHKALAAEMAAETDLVRGLGAEGAGRAA